MYTYKIEVIGTNASKNITDISRFEQYVSKLMSAIGQAAVKNIRARMMEKEWKRKPVLIQRALGWRSDTWWVDIFIDPTIAPHAVYQEYGVEEHVMRYLLKATCPIPRTLGRGKGAATIYRWATEKWMGVPHSFVEPFSGMVMEATGWVHPGYPAKNFFTEGIVDTIKEAVERSKALVLRIARQEMF